MQLKKAREIIDLNLNQAGSTMPPDVKLALTLAVENFDRTLEGRKYGYDHFLRPLPSETAQ